MLVCLTRSCVQVPMLCACMVVHSQPVWTLSLPRSCDWFCRAKAMTGFQWMSWLVGWKARSKTAGRRAWEWPPVHKAVLMIMATW